MIRCQPSLLNPYVSFSTYLQLYKTPKFFHILYLSIDIKYDIMVNELKNF